MLNVVMLTVVMPTLIMPTVVMLTVIMLRVVAPRRRFDEFPDGSVSTKFEIRRDFVRPRSSTSLSMRCESFNNGRFKRIFIGIPFMFCR